MMGYLKIKCGGIYMIEVGDYYYIGMSNNVFERWNSHYTSLMQGIHSSPSLQDEFNRVGVEGLKFQVLEYISMDDFKLSTGIIGKELDKEFNKHLLKREKEWMRKYSVTFSLNKSNRHFG